MAAEDASEYECLKAAILKRYNINEGTYRVRFRAVARKPEEGYAEMATRVLDLLRKWMRECTSMEEVMEMVAVEQMLNSLPAEMRVWVCEKKPKTVTEVGKLADDFAQARGPNGGGRRVPVGPRPDPGQRQQCHNCGLVGHLARDCRKGGLGAGQKTPIQPGKRKTVRCYNRHQPGHIASRCPSRAALYMGQGHPKTEVQVEERGETPPTVIEGEVDGVHVANILVDTGAARTMVHKNLVPEAKLMGQDSHVSIRCAHGDSVEYPLARVTVSVRGKPYSLVAAVSESLPVSVLLGRDVPVLIELLQVAGSAADVLVMTRAQKRQHQQAEAELDSRNATAGAETTPVELEEAEGEGAESFGAEFADDLFSEGRRRVHLTRRQRRLHNARVVQQRGQADPLDLSAAELKELQQTDDSLNAVRHAAMGQPSTVAETGFLERDGLLFRRWKPVSGGDLDMEVEQLVLPV